MTFAPNNFATMRINRETELRDDHIRARRKQHVADKLDDFVRAVAENQVGRLDAEFLRQFLFQIKRVAVGIKIHARQWPFASRRARAATGRADFRSTRA